ncbi:MAG: type II/IV secretion system ATPase subunit [Anaerolineales bacterium]|nr:type II/IV secretion system ATPase subunit [Anaerolineales bacterium]
MKEELPLGTVLFSRQNSEPDSPEHGESSLQQILTSLALTQIRERLNASELNRVKKEPALKVLVHQLIAETVEEENTRRVSRGQIPVLDRGVYTVERWTERIFRDLYGLGALEPLLEDEKIEDIAVNGPNEVMVRTFEGWRRLDVDLCADDDQLLWRVNQVIAFSGKQAGPLMPIVDVQLPAGHRLNVVTEPLTDPWPVLVIRRHRQTSWTIDEFLHTPVCTAGPQQAAALPDYQGIAVPGALLTAEAAAYLHMAVLSGLNILVIGRTGVGKTTFLSALGRLIPTDRRVVVIEDTRELKLREGNQPQNCVYFYTRQKLLEGGIDVDMRQLILAALRQRPDHLVLGEARGAEIYDLLNAMQTGHGGNLTSIHANSLADLGQRVNAMLYQAGVDMSADRSARLISTSFHVGVTLLQDFDGRRYVAEIGEFTGGVRGFLPEMKLVFRGGRSAGFGLERLVEESVFENILQRTGLSFNMVKSQKGGGL